MSAYRKVITVTQHDLDDLKHVNNVRYLEWVQEISREHWVQQVANAEHQNYIWVVRNHTITYHKSAVLGDEIEITTRVLEWKGPLSVRFVEMKHNKTKELLVNATTEWCLLHPETGKPVRVPAALQLLFQ